MIEFGRCVYIRDKRPQEISAAIITPGNLVLRCGSAIADHGVINLSESIYACLYSEMVNYICLVTKGADSRPLAFYIRDDEDFAKTVASIKENFPSLTYSAQNNHINSYAKSVAAKLREGVELIIIDSIVGDNIVECPECGAANEYNENMPFCMECGAALK
ncbi:MAG: zinc ribbon domain-containing protein [Mogibacterium sp.]|nr:zinc ribbon domain-containing protein [Mogibacterium sp.]